VSGMGWQLTTTYVTLQSPSLRTREPFRGMVMGAVSTFGVNAEGNPQRPEGGDNTENGKRPGCTGGQSAK
jgi:hypothetical protein